MIQLKDKHHRQVNCPAGELVHPVHSLNKADVRCRVGAPLYPAKDSPCCSAYSEECTIWKSVRKLEMASTTKRQRDLSTPGPRPDAR